MTSLIVYNNNGVIPSLFLSKRIRSPMQRWIRVHDLLEWLWC